MKINFTKKQYETLFKMVQYGYWVASDTEDNKEEFSEMEQYLNSFAKDFGMEGVQFEKEYEIYDLSRELEDQLQTVINEYEEGVFRDKLAYHLARKYDCEPLPMFEVRGMNGCLVQDRLQV